MADFVVNRAEATCCTRRAQLHGREHLVVPVVALLPGVVNGEYVPADELAASAQLWNDVPIPIEHPRERGVLISARQPEVLEQALAGRLYSVTVGPDGRLRGEMWLDVDRVTALGYGDMLALLQAGGPLDVSTAYFRELELTPGEFGGKRYEGIARNLRPDHLALLPKSKGACSWSDGCGAPRVNDTGTTQADASTGTDEDEDEDESDDDGSRKPEVAANVQSVSVGGRQVEDVKSEQAPAEIEAPATNAQAVPPEVTELLVAINELGGVAGLRQALADIKANADAERNALVAELTANERSAFGADEIKAMSTDMLRKLAASLRPADYRGRGAPQVNEGAEWVVLVAPEVK